MLQSFHPNVPDVLEKRRCHRDRRCCQHVGVSQNRGILAPKWMVYNGKPYQNGWFGGPPLFLETSMSIHVTASSLWFETSSDSWCRCKALCTSRALGIRPQQNVEIKFVKLKFLTKSICQQQIALICSTLDTLSQVWAIKNHPPTPGTPLSSVVKRRCSPGCEVGIASRGELTQLVKVGCNFWKKNPGMQQRQLLTICFSMFEKKPTWRGLKEFRNKGSLFRKFPSHPYSNNQPRGSQSSGFGAWSPSACHKFVMVGYGSLTSSFISKFEPGA